MLGVGLTPPSEDEESVDVTVDCVDGRDMDLTG
jgi:hypothetical protein